MKILIADDEMPIREWLTMKLNAVTGVSCEVVGAAANGSEALRIFQEKRPDVVFADIKMPVMDGLELLSRIKKLAPDTAVLLLTSHTDFDYARRAVSDGAMDYVLKSEITPERLEQLLKKAEQEQKKERGEQDKTLPMQLKRQIFLNHVVQQGEISGTDLVERMQHNGIPLEEGMIIAIAFSSDWLGGGFPRDYDSAQADERIRNICFFSYDQDTIVMLANVTCSPSLLMQQNMQQEIAQLFHQGIHTPFGVGAICQGLKRLPSAISSSIRALNLKFYSQTEYAYAQPGQGDDTESLKKLDDYKSVLYGQLQGGQWNEARGTFFEILEAVGQFRISDVQYVKKFFITLLCNYLLKTAPNQGMQLMENMEELRDSIYSAESYAALQSYLRERIERCNRHMHDAEAEYSMYVRVAMEYIEANYSTIESVAEIADHLNLNQDYFSRIFKNETGMTTSQYLTDVRLKQAVYLLQNTNQKVYMIAEKVGYTNLSYFSKKFKQKFRVGPFEFRNAYYNNI